MDKRTSIAVFFERFALNEDWLAVAIAGGIILLSALGIFGPHGIPIRF